MPGYSYSRDGEAGVLLRGGRERRRARGSGPQQSEPASSGDVGRRDRRTGRDPESRMRLAAQRPLLPALQGMLLHTPLRPRGASARPVFRLHVRLPRVSAYMVPRAVSARVEDHVRSDAKFPGGGDAGDRTAGHGSVGLPLPQHPRIQPETTGRPSPKGRPAGRVARRFQHRVRRGYPLPPPPPHPPLPLGSRAIIVAVFVYLWTRTRRDRRRAIAQTTYARSIVAFRVKLARERRCLIIEI